MSWLRRRTVQRQAPFRIGVPAAGYYNDLTLKTAEHGNPAAAQSWLQATICAREALRPVSVVQLGLGAWQRATGNAVDGVTDTAWSPVVRDVAEWVVCDMDGYGRLMHEFSMPHTFPLDAPWASAMAQGQAVSMLVRAAGLLEDGDLLGDASRAARSLLEPELGLIARTASGPVLQEYPTPEPAHVLNGWIFALFGLYDLAAATGAQDARRAFHDGVGSLVARLHLYECAGGWSRYDLYPHPTVHVASPFYHRLHVELLRALDTLEPRATLRDTADRWQNAAESPSITALAVARKVGFRLRTPRSRRAA